MTTRSALHHPPFPLIQSAYQSVLDSPILQLKAFNLLTTWTASAHFISRATACLLFLHLLFSARLSSSCFSFPTFWLPAPRYTPTPRASYFPFAVLPSQSAAMFPFLLLSPILFSMLVSKLSLSCFSSPEPVIPLFRYPAPQTAFTPRASSFPLLLLLEPSSSCSKATSTVFAQS